MSVQGYCFFLIFISNVYITTTACYIYLFIYSFSLGIIKSLNPQHYIPSNDRMISEQRTGNHLAARGWP
jgi:hypothetical protein